MATLSACSSDTDGNDGPTPSPSGTTTSTSTAPSEREAPASPTPKPATADFGDSCACPPDATSTTCSVGSGCKSGLECLRREQRCTKACKPQASSSDPDTCGGGWKCTMIVVNGVNAGAVCTPN
ncbi:MAG: hypothetical protein JNM74_22900 [Myxococcales bacterium]|nr:hypothetical protein [Myxococcales bacterium]